ncbi:MAG TPA: O-methyltransferase [Bacteroidetes bacterium]|jgi:predicted O-methyltransferase YrrM|nr:O-methyltransferase [Bacteroidota bacterium]
MPDLSPELEEYIRNHTEPEDPLMEELERITHTLVLNPHMLSGRIQGKILEMFSRMIRPKTILEIGTYTGYSALCLARGLKKGGKLHTIEKNDELEDLIRSFFTRSPMGRHIHLHMGDALDIIPRLKEPFDLVFIDGEKAEYPAYYRQVLPRVKPGGYILADNLLWNGKVTHPPRSRDRSTRGILEFARMVRNDDGVQNVLFPVRDGLMVIRKKEK